MEEEDRDYLTFHKEEKLKHSRRRHQKVNRRTKLKKRWLNTLSLRNRTQEELEEDAERFSQQMMNTSSCSCRYCRYWKKVRKMKKERKQAEIDLKKEVHDADLQDL